MLQSRVLIGCVAVAMTSVLSGCQSGPAEPVAQALTTPAPAAAPVRDATKFLTQPLISQIYTADPSAHVFRGRIYIYPSHDIETGMPRDELGNHFGMRDYHVLSMNAVDGPVKDHGVALDVADVPWASRQMWAPDAAQKDGKYYLYFPAKDRQDIFRIGVAVADNPAGPFKAQPAPIKGTYSMDPAVFEDAGRYYLIFGGIRGGQLQRWASGSYRAEDTFPADDQPALTPKIARLGTDMTSLDEELRDVVIQDEHGKPLLAGDNARRFFEAAWLHKYRGTYYLSYSTGDTHYIVYATSNSVYGPYTYRGRILEPVQGWTTHQSIVEFRGQWLLFYHDSQLSGQTHLRNIKVTPLQYDADGSIRAINPLLD
ncbi:MAG TPA: glycoside hydrolase family 43 protein [Povalibacter sp.]|nr:glycoside hydrolase family 43 protein [Povalibacter sp.]